MRQQSHWDQKITFYASKLYSNQLGRGATYSELRGVVGMSLVGGGLDEKEGKDVTAMSRITMTKDGTPLRNGINIYNYALTYHKNLNNV